MTFPLAMSLSNIGMIVLLVLGFGFVIFWHELGHFLAAKWVGIRVEQFAVGFGQALVSWRKGIGFRMGNTQQEYRARAEERLMQQRRPSRQDDDTPQFSDTEIGSAGDELGLGETEYRLNWIPLGGYVKMLGQDDLKPDAVAEDPRAYNKKSIGARMIVISAGVIMNIILAAIGFMVLFLIGFKVAPAWVGKVIPGSPAQRAGMQVGDHIVTFDGKPQEDFTKITLNTALAPEGKPVEIVVDRPNPDGKTFTRHTLTVTPARPNGDKAFLQIGFSAPAVLEGVKKGGDVVEIDTKKVLERVPLEAVIVAPGDKILAVNGQPVKPDDFVKLFNIVQNSYGQKVTLTLVDSDGKPKTENTTFQPHFEEPFSGPFNIAGMLPRAAIQQMQENSPVVGRIKPFDVVESLKDSDPLPHPSREQLMARLAKDAESGKPITLTVLSNGESKVIDNIKDYVKLGEGRRGLGVGLMPDEQNTVVADVAADSPAAKAGIQGGDRITAINETPVATWYDVHRILVQLPKPASGNLKVNLTYDRPGAGKPQSAEMSLDAAQLSAVHEITYYSPLQLAELNYPPRQTSNPITAAKWGVIETRDFTLQFYLTLRRMAERSVSPSNMMGPVGIFAGGARFAQRGLDWLIWFLAMISANLAVVNFLPIPVVDGGQFMFLIFEKIKGKPLSPRAMAIAQYVGLAFLAAVVLFVTYHDILRMT